MAADCSPCLLCSEPWCNECDEHYAECLCIGPSQDEAEYVMFNGVLYARIVEDAQPSVAASVPSREQDDPKQTTLF